MATGPQSDPDNPNGSPKAKPNKPVRQLTNVAVRFAGDSGDGMQLAGSQFTDTSALLGNDVSTFPDYPAEIRAPAGTLAGVSGFQVHFSAEEIYTPGDEVDALVAMNPAALRVNLAAVRDGGIVIVNEDAFGPVDLKKAGYTDNPLDDPALSSRYRLIKVPISKLNKAATSDAGLTVKEAERCKNMFALGLVYWLYGRGLETTLKYLHKKFAKKPNILQANEAAIKSGHAYGETLELFHEQYQVPKAKLAPGTYRKVTGNDAIALGIVTASKISGKKVIYCSYPITPASDILHSLSHLKQHNVITFQAEDEIAAIGAAIGVSFGGELAVTGSSGPGIALKSEAIGLAVMVELPVVVISVQRGGPSTGLPTKTEQADLLQIMYGRNGECPVPVIAAASPSDCFNAAIEAFRIATRYMTPVFVLSDGYIANSAEPWMIPDVSTIDPLVIDHPTQINDDRGFMPYKRNADLSRPWAIPGTPALEHRIGGLEKQDETGNVSYDPANHEHMVKLRADKVAGIKPAGEPLLWTGPERGDVLIIGWGGTHGALKVATMKLNEQGIKTAHAHLRYLNPLPQLGDLLRNFRHVVVAELNSGQLRMLIRARWLVDAKGLNKVRGQPFTIAEVVRAIQGIVAAEETAQSA
ncbi:MAG: 2-oxoacid:acceptor oxidoreductase subunit alpha [Phycisphaerales bacterium]|nr:2-oxoacid:acceptor oxidoreductase subunit alpha [Phycisphaerales bacterium]